MVDKSHVEQLLAQYFRILGEVEIMADGGVNVSGDVTLIKTPPQGIIPVKFGIVDGTFRASNKDLTSLRNSPDSCLDLYVGSNRLTSLEHCTVYTNTLSVDNNLLTSLQDAPLCHMLWATDNPFVSFKDTPAHIAHVVISYDPKLPMLGLLSVKKIEFEHDPDDETQSKQVEEILNRYTGQGRAGQLKCAAELVRHGFKQHARI